MAGGICGITGLMHKLRPNRAHVEHSTAVLLWFIVGCSLEVPDESGSTAEPDASELLRGAGPYVYGDDGTAQNLNEATRLYQQACERELAPCMP